MGLTEEELAAITARAEDVGYYWNSPESVEQWQRMARLANEDIPALVAEVRRLRAALMIYEGVRVPRTP